MLRLYQEGVSYQANVATINSNIRRIAITCGEGKPTSPPRLIIPKIQVRVLAWARILFSKFLTVHSNVLVQC